MRIFHKINLHLPPLVVNMNSMNNVVCLHDKFELEAFFKLNPLHHIYSIGDLDSCYWPFTTWYGLKSNDSLKAVALMYSGLSLPTLLAFSSETEVMTNLLGLIKHLLPGRFYAHLSSGLQETLMSSYNLESHGEHYKMALIDKSPVMKIDCSDVERLSAGDIASIKALFEESYPDNWFEAKMLQTNPHFGIRSKNVLASIAGTHVYSPDYKVAALGNITTHPDFRGKNLGSRVTAGICQSLINEGIEIGLNVKADNKAAISCYKKLGFEVIATYEEFMVKAKN